MPFRAFAMPCQLTSPVPGSVRPGTSATWISPIHGRQNSAELDQIPLSDLRMIKVQVEAKTGMVHRGNQR